MGAKRDSIQPDAVIARVAARQHGVVSRQQLLDAGLSARMLGTRLEGGILRPLHRGVYVFGYRTPARVTLWHAALLAIGQEAALSVGDAADIWRFGPQATGSVSVTSPTGRRLRRGIDLHCAPLEDGDWVLRDGLRVTSPARTLLDLAATQGSRELERALDEAHYLNRVSATSLEETLRRNGGRTGTAALRRARSPRARLDAHRDRPRGKIPDADPGSRPAGASLPGVDRAAPRGLPLARPPADRGGRRRAFPSRRAPAGTRRGPGRRPGGEGLRDPPRRRSRSRRSA